MNSYPFKSGRGPILVEAQITGPAMSTDVRLLLDTAATMSLIDLTILSKLGFDPAQPIRRVQMTTGHATGIVPVYPLTRFSALGQHHFLFPVIGHTLPATTGVDGLLGLDFLRAQVLTIDFRSGQITLALRHGIGLWTRLL